MAPKRKITGRGASSSRKKPVRKPVPTAPESSSNSSSSSWPEAPPSSSNPLSGRLVTTGRKVNFEFLEIEGFTIGRMLTDMGWRKLCSLNVPTYPVLVQEFYASASKGDSGLVATVRGKTIKVNQSILSNLLEMPTVGMSPTCHGERGAAMSRLVGRQIEDFEEISANQLPVEYRLLHNICGRILFPKIGRFDFVSERDIVVMDCILGGHPINLPDMMIGYMTEACNKKKATLPYGMVLTIVFRSQGLTIPENEPKKELRHTDFYDASTLHRMGYKKINGTWEKKASEEVPASRHRVDLPEPSTAPEVSTSVPSAPVPVPSVLTSDIIESLKDFISAEQEKSRNLMKEQFDYVFEKINSLSNRVTSIEDQYSKSAELLKNEIVSFSAKIKDLSDSSKDFADSNAKLLVHIDNAMKQLEEMLSNFKSCQKDGMEAILDRIKRIFGAI